VSYIAKLAFRGLIRINIITVRPLDILYEKLLGAQSTWRTILIAFDRIEVVKMVFVSLKNLFGRRRNMDKVALLKQPTKEEKCK